MLSYKCGRRLRRHSWTNAAVPGDDDAEHAAIIAAFRNGSSSFAKRSSSPAEDGQLARVLVTVSPRGDRSGFELLHLIEI